MNRYKCEKKNFFLRKKFFRGGPAHPVKKKFFRPSAGKIFFWIHLDTPGYTWQLPGVAGYTWKAWKVSQGMVFGHRCILKLSGGGGIAKKKFQGGVGYAWHNPTCTYDTSACARLRTSMMRVGHDGHLRTTDIKKASLPLSFCSRISPHFIMG